MRRRIPSVLVPLTLFALACSPPAANTGGTGSAADEAAVKAMASKYAESFNARDAKAMGAVLAADYTDVDPATGKQTMGRDSAIAGMATMWKQVPAEMKMTVSTSFVKWIDATHAVASGTYQMTGVPAGMPNHGAWMDVAVKQDSSWVMMSSLGGDAPPEPPAAASKEVPSKAPAPVKTKP